MSEFTFLFRGRNFRMSAQETQKAIERWAEWFRELTASGIVKYHGHPLAATGIIVSGKERRISEAADLKQLVAGYVVVEATDLPHATQLSLKCPILDTGGSVEVRPIDSSGE